MVFGKENGNYKIRPNNDVFTDLAPNSDNWFLDVNYKGAFMNDNWLFGWTLISQEGKIQF